MPWVDEHGWLQRTIPSECVADCSASGSVDGAVEYWVNKLRFDVPQDLAVKYLKPYGAWDSEELSDHDANNRRILWTACSDIKEQGEWLGVVH